MDALLRTCTAMLLHLRPTLMAGDFASNLRTLQHFPPVDVNVLLRRAAAMPPCYAVVGPP